MGKTSGKAHAKLSASGSKRWINCPPSVKLESKFENKTSIYADEGTCAHELAELRLKLKFKALTNAEFNNSLDLLKNSNLGVYYSQEMEDHVRKYVDFITETFGEIAKIDAKDPKVLFESLVDISEYTGSKEKDEDGFGTVDAQILGETILHIVDLKYGANVHVDAFENSQGMLYALGALESVEAILHNFDIVRITIVQPRRDNVSTYEIQVDKLLEWAETVVKPAAKLAHAGKGTFKPGDHCQFCKAKNLCKARADKMLDIAKFDFKDPNLLTDEEVASVLDIAKEFTSWINDVTSFAAEQAIKHDKIWPGYKLVAGKSSRVISDEKSAATTLRLEGYTDDQIYTKKLLGITALEKMLGKTKFADLLNAYISKPDGAPSLVPESDKRTALKSLDAAKSDFEN